MPQNNPTDQPDLEDDADIDDDILDDDEALDHKELVTLITSSKENADGILAKLSANKRQNLSACLWESIHLLANNEYCNPLLRKLFELETSDEQLNAKLSDAQKRFPNPMQHSILMMLVLNKKPDYELISYLVGRLDQANLSHHKKSNETVIHLMADPQCMLNPDEKGKLATAILKNSPELYTVKARVTMGATALGYSEVFNYNQRNEKLSEAINAVIQKKKNEHDTERKQQLEKKILLKKNKDADTAILAALTQKMQGDFAKQMLEAQHVPVNLNTNGQSISEVIQKIRAGHNERNDDGALSSMISCSIDAQNQVLQVLENEAPPELINSLWRTLTVYVRTPHCGPIIKKLIDLEKDNDALDEKANQIMDDNSKGRKFNLLMELMMQDEPDISVIAKLLLRLSEKSVGYIAKFDQTALHLLTRKDCKIGKKDCASLATAIIRKAPQLLNHKTHFSKGGYTPLEACDMDQTKYKTSKLREAIQKQMENLAQGKSLENNDQELETLAQSNNNVKNPKNTTTQSAMIEYMENNNNNNNNSSTELMDILHQIEKFPDLDHPQLCLINALVKADINVSKVIELLDTHEFPHLEETLWKRVHILAEHLECYPVISKLIDKEKDDARLDRRFCELEQGRYGSQGKTLLMCLISFPIPVIDVIKLVISRSQSNSLMIRSKFNQTLLHHLVTKNNKIPDIIRGQLAEMIIQKAPGLLNIRNCAAKGEFTPLQACDMEQSKSHSIYVKQAILNYMAQSIEQIPSAPTRAGMFYTAPTAIRQPTSNPHDTEPPADVYKRKADDEESDSAKRFKDRQ